MLSFTLCPFEGAPPVTFGLSRSEVRKLLGPPDVAGQQNDSWGPRLEKVVGYGEDNKVNHIGFSPGEFELLVDHEVVWSPNSEVDPNPLFLRMDPEPLEYVGFLVFARLGITTTGFHDENPGQYAITLFPRGEWDQMLLKAKRPNLAKYKE